MSCKLTIFLCLLFIGSTISIKCYVGKPSTTFEEKECQDGLICGKLVVDDRNQTNLYF